MPPWKPALLLLLLALPVAAGQTVEFAVSYPPGGSPRLQAALSAVPAGTGTAGLRVAAGEELELGIRLREAGSLATVGNLVTSLAADGSSAGRFAAALSARGVLGPVALRLRASASDGLGPLAPLDEGAFSPLPRLGAGPTLLGLEAGTSYRISRGLIADAGTGLFLRGGRLGGRLEGELRMVRLVGEDDLSLLVHAFGAPGFDRLALALGVGYTVNRRRAPSWSAGVWLGWGPGGLAPGVRLAGGERVAGGEVTLALAAEPYRLEAWPYRLDLGYRQPVGPGELLLEVRGGLVPEHGWRLGASAGYRLPFDP